MFLCVTKRHAIKTYGGAKLQNHAFMTRHYMDVASSIVLEGVKEDKSLSLLVIETQYLSYPDTKT
jgi:hypothetical protein